MSYLLFCVEKPVYGDKARQVYFVNVATLDAPLGFFVISDKEPKRRSEPKVLKTCSPLRQPFPVRYTRPPNGALPRNNLAASATGGTSVVSSRERCAENHRKSLPREMPHRIFPLVENCIDFRLTRSAAYRSKL